MSEHVNKPEAGLKTQEEIKLKVSENSANAANVARGKFESATKANSVESKLDSTVDKKSCESESSNQNKEETPREELSRQAVLNPKEPKTNAHYDPIESISSVERSSSSGLRRHRLIVGSCCSVSLIVLAFSMFDLTHLISRDVTIEKDLQIDNLGKRADLPPTLNYTDSYSLAKHRYSDLLSVSKSSWKGKKFGYVDINGKVVIEPQFDGYRPFFEGLAGVQVGTEKDEKWGVIDETGKFIVKPQYDQVYDFQEGVSTFRVENRYGIIDRTGKVIFEPTLTYSRRVRNAFVVETNRYRMGILGLDGKWLLPPVYSSVWDFKADSGTVVSDEIFPSPTSSDIDKHADYLGFRQNEKWGIVTPEGKIIIQPKYEGILSFRNDVAAISVDGKIGFADTKGKILIAPKYDATTPFADLIAVKIKKDWSFIDRAGAPVKAPKVDGIIAQPNGDWFADGLGAVIINGQVGYINGKGELQVKPQFDIGLPFKGGHAIVRINDRWRFIDTAGKFVPGLEFSKIRRDFKERTCATIAGPLYPLVEGQQVKNMRSEIKKWMGGKHVFRRTRGW